MRRDRDTAYTGRNAVLIALSIVCCIAFLFGCAGKGKQPTHKRLPPSDRHLPEGAMRPAPVPPAESAGTPERRASMRLIDQGREFLDTDDFERATETFRDAINVDATNGIAYYYLALTYYYLDRPDLSAGLLDKAEALLGYDEEWGAKIDELRIELKVPSPPGYSTEPAEKDGSF